MEEKLVEVLEKFEESFVEFTKGKEAFSLKSDYIDMKYGVVKLFLSAVDETIDFDFENFVEKQKSLPLLRNEMNNKVVNRWE